MRLFLYYASHSFINTMKKMFKSWLAILMICLIFGGLVGLVIGKALPKNKKKAATPTTTQVGTVTEDEDEDVPEAIKDVKEMSVSSKSLKKIFSSRNISKADVVDFIVSAVFFLILAANIASSKNSGKIFQPGDVPMLFASPLKPQSVMLFRLVGQLATQLMLSLFMVFQLPNLIYNAKLGVWGAVSLLIAYALICMFSTLVQVSFYTIMSNAKKNFKDITYWLIGFFGILAVAFFVFKSVTKQDTLTAAVHFLASKKTFWVPFWGWLRGMCYYGVEGNIKLSLLFVGLFVIGCVLLIVFIWKMKADFYEDAIAAAEEKAELFEKAKNAKGGIQVIRTKDRSDKLDRDGFHFGHGANVFFYKAIFNRFRFGILKIFSKTMIIFTLAAGVAAWFSKDSSKGSFLIPICILIVLTFYRTLGNPLSEDTSREFFVLVPDSPFMKLWYSLLGSITVNAIDLFIPIVLATVMTKTNPLVALVWYLFILTVSLFGTVVGTFINVSVPGESGQTIKLMAQMFFLYFGMMPSLALAIAGVLLHVEVITLSIGLVVNTGLSMLFCLLTPRFLENK